MSTRERILALRLLEKQKKNPRLAKEIGVHIQMIQKEKNKKEKEEIYYEN